MTGERVRGALADGRALPVGTLAAEAGLTPRAVREQLADLLAEGAVEELVSGPYRYYRCPDARARRGSAGAAGGRGFVVRSLRPGSPAYDLRLARRCYGHLAGRLGVAVTDALRARGWIVGPDGHVDLAALARGGGRLAGGVGGTGTYRVTVAGAAGLAALGVRLPARLGDVSCCVDWTEQRHHLAGPLGTALLDAFSAAGWVAPSATPRALRVGEAGTAGFVAAFGVSWPGEDMAAAPAAGSPPAVGAAV